MDEKMTKTSEISDSAEMMSNHTMKLICYEINLGTVRGQKIHALHLIFLPLLPIRPGLDGVSGLSPFLSAILSGCCRGDNGGG